MGGRSRTRRTGSSGRRALELVRRPEQQLELRQELRKVKGLEQQKPRGLEEMKEKESAERLREMRVLNLVVSLALRQQRQPEPRLVFELVGWQVARLAKLLARRLPWRRQTRPAMSSAERGCPPSLPSSTRSPRALPWRRQSLPQGLRQ